MTANRKKAPALPERAREQVRAYTAAEIAARGLPPVERMAKAQGEARRLLELAAQRAQECGEAKAS